MIHKILTIVGARPNFIKAAPVGAALAAAQFAANKFAAAQCFEEIMVHTGQHYDANLSDDLFSELEISPPKYNLGIGSGRQAWQLGQMISKIDEIIAIENPDLVLVFGDTNSTAAGAIAAAKNNIPVAHVEAGLREHDKRIPEEVNKLLTTAIADLYFCPTPTGVKNLAQSGITRNVHLVGDVGIDLIFNNLEKITANNSVFEKYGIQPGNYYFFTCHRANNTEHREPLEQILKALEQLELPVIFPIHPRTDKAIRAFGLPHPSSMSHVRAVPPIGFFDTQALIRSAKTAITDSGGVVKEAYFHRTPGILIDRQTEWVETVEEGWNHIAGPDCEAILRFSKQVEIPKLHTNCLGDGSASLKIAAILKKYLDARN